ncbi:PE family protein, partial [Mycobacterium sp. 1423905.2]|uniref:PE family protein n=1 Tax=Mycobacterium sp. 1423905.2 TaxID=1856859 RepID=UPI000A4C6F37
MQPLTFHPVVADIGQRVIDIATACLQAGSSAQSTVTGLVPAGADEVSAQAMLAFQNEAASMLALNQAAQEELARTGAAFTQIANTYIAADRAAAGALV